MTAAPSVDQKPEPLIHILNLHRRSILQRNIGHASPSNLAATAETPPWMELRAPKIHPPRVRVSWDLQPSVFHNRSQQAGKTRLPITQLEPQIL